MLNRTRISSALLVLGGLFAATAGADTEAGAAGSEYDADKHGMTQHGAAKQGPTFSELDADGNGSISQEEMLQADTDLSVRHSALDSDNNGEVDRAEFAAFERMERGPEGAQPGGMAPESDTDSDQSWGEDQDYSEDQDY